MLAQQTGTVSCILFNIPYQRVSFAEDWKDSRREDDLIAYTWARFLNETRGKTGRTFGEKVIKYLRNIKRAEVTQKCSFLRQ